MYTLKELNNQIVHSYSVKLPKDFVAAAVAVDRNGNAYHAGLVISYKGQVCVFHYTGSSIVLQPVPEDDWYLHKHLDFIHEEDVPAFVIHCQSIKKDANPKYGYYFGGDYYVDGKYFSETEASEIMTCAGFCLNVLLGFIEADEYLAVEDWDANDPDTRYTVYVHGQPEHLTADEYIEYYVNAVKKIYQPDELAVLKKNLRRIYPIQYLASAFMENLPIRKSEIDQNVENIQKILTKKAADLVLLTLKAS